MLHMPDTDQLLRFLSFLRIVSSFLISGYGFLFSCKTPITNFFSFLNFNKHHETIFSALKYQYSLENLTVFQPLFSHTKV